MSTVQHGRVNGRPLAVGLGPARIRKGLSWRSPELEKTGTRENIPMACQGVDLERKYCYG